MIKFKEFLDEALFKRVSRVRSGKIQRRHVVSNRPGYKVVDGKVVRMSPLERRKRHLAQIKAARKRKPLLTRILRKRTLSLRRRKSAGIK